MTRKSVVLQTKLQELESELADVFRLPLPDATSSDQRHQISFDDIEQRFVFLNKLLSAEVATQPETSDQLHEVRQRLTGLKTAFRVWKESITRAFDNHDDSLSICSDCTQALQYDTVRESSSSPISKVENFSSERSSEEESMDSVEKDEAAEERIWSKVGRYFGAFGSGMIVGAICMVELLYSSNQYEDFLLPPT